MQQLGAARGNATVQSRHAGRYDDRDPDERSLRNAARVCSCRAAAHRPCRSTLSGEEAGGKIPARADVLFALETFSDLSEAPASVRRQLKPWMVIAALAGVTLTLLTLYGA